MAQKSHSQKKNSWYSWRGLVKKTDYSAKVSEIESKIPRIGGLATNAALTAVKLD